ncbi:hypothetical protein QE418_003431 [Microbacterium testaceum]|uniref:hypothetical protein n=1 Tax=Microbacterium TaxID=33882 RepID=UPI0027825E0D|nr:MULTISPECIES: hypothetical protein [Microbacterium]MDQ1113983.1 hypothetical protein [Microbacterium testaceum]MDR6098911.1 hypothetical protein [Microbacterium sp. SORGH_AS_0454]
MSDEFEGILQYADDAPVERPPMSVPPRVVASSVFIREVRVALAIDDDDQARVVADWIVDKMERFGARSAEPVFDMKGHGPKCSWCGMIWPLCGHHHQSAVDFGDDDESSDS